MPPGEPQIVLERARWKRSVATFLRRERGSASMEKTSEMHMVVPPVTNNDMMGIGWQ